MASTTTGSGALEGSVAAPLMVVVVAAAATRAVVAALRVLPSITECFCASPVVISKKKRVSVHFCLLVFKLLTVVFTQGLYLWTGTPVMNIKRESVCVHGFLTILKSRLLSLSLFLSLWRMSSCVSFE